MSETMREALPIMFMFMCIGGMGVFVVIAMWMAFDGDRLREPLDVVETLPAATVDAPAQSAGNKVA